VLFNDVKEKNGWADKRATNEYKTNIKSCKAHRYENCTTLLQQQRQKQRKTKLIQMSQHHNSACAPAIVAMANF